MICARCEHTFPDDKSLCPSCKFWNTQLSSGLKKIDETVILQDVKSAEQDRILTGIADDAFGGGITRGSVILLGGYPGAGKSTLILQIAESVSYLGEVIYVATEEKPESIKARADRIGLEKQDKIRMVPAMGGMSNVNSIIEQYKPIFTIVDSLQGLVGEDKGLAVTACRLLKGLAEKYNCPIIIISHVTKGDDFAGLMTLQHDVDTLMTLNPDEDSGFRSLETVKNRNGPAPFGMQFEMTETGLIPIGYTDEDEEE